MEYDFYRSKELVHSVKGSSWSNHKYTSKIFKNGKWFYFYGNSGSNKSLTDRFREWSGENARRAMNEAAFRTGSAKERYKNGSEANRAGAYASYRQYGADYTAKKKAYSQTPLGKLERAGSKAGAAFKKGKDWLDNRIKKKQKSRIKVTGHTTTRNG